MSLAHVFERCIYIFIIIKSIECPNSFEHQTRRKATIIVIIIIGTSKKNACIRNANSQTINEIKSNIQNEREWEPKRTTAQRQAEEGRWTLRDVEEEKEWTMMMKKKNCRSENKGKTNIKTYNEICVAAISCASPKYMSRTCTDKCRQWRKNKNKICTYECM